MSAIVAGALITGIVVGASSIERVLAAGGAGPNTACSSSSACVSYANSGSGPGVASSSAKGSGLTGTTTLTGTGSSNAPGVLGTDASTSGHFDSGVEGVTKAGTGVLGTAKNGTGVKGTSNSGEGVKGTSAASGFAGVDGTSTSSTGIGVIGTSPFVGMEATGLIGLIAAEQGSSPGTALQVNSDNTGGQLILGRNGFNTIFNIDESGNFSTGGAVSDNTENTNLLIANSPATNVAIDGRANSTTFAAIEADADQSSGNLYDGFDSFENLVYVLDASGNIRIAGQIYTAGGCSSGCINRGPGARRVVSYTSRESQPTIEDFGSGQLVHGRAHVALAADFANVIDRGASFMVFLTPNGDCNGLYVADKTTQGFDVGELRGGTSSVAFDYRVVAKPFGDRSVRLPMVNMQTVRPTVISRHTHA